jgi:O-antigen ligase
LWSREIRPFVIAVLALVGANAISAIPATYIDPVLRETAKALEYAIVFACCVLATVSDPDPLPFRRALIAAVSVVSLLAMAQEFLGASSGVYIGAHAVPRIAGPLEGPNQLACYLGLAIPVLFALAISTRRALYTGACSLAFLALVLTLSRAGLVSTLLAIGFLIIVLRGADIRIFLLAGAAALAAVVGVLASVGGLSRIFSVADTASPTGLASRSLLWAAAIKLWARSPWLGIGAGNYELSLPSVGLLSARTHANSIYLQALSEGGFPLLLATLGSLIVPIVAFVRSRSRDPIVLGATAATFGLALHQVFDFLTFYPKVGMLWWILLGVAAGRLVAERVDAAAQEPAQQS